MSGSSSSPSSSSSTAMSSMEAARVEVLNAEKEIQDIKKILSQIRSPLGSGDDPSADENVVKISALKVMGLPLGTPSPLLKVQMSSPIEELTLNKVWDPLDAECDGSVAVFRGVDTEMATVTVTAWDVNKALIGTSASLDINPMTTFNARNPVKHITTIDVALVMEENNTNIIADIATTTIYTDEIDQVKQVVNEVVKDESTEEEEEELVTVEVVDDDVDDDDDDDEEEIKCETVSTSDVIEDVDVIESDAVNEEESPEKAIEEFKDCIDESLEEMVQVEAENGSEDGAVIEKVVDVTTKSETCSASEPDKTSSKEVEESSAVSNESVTPPEPNQVEETSESIPPASEEAPESPKLLLPSCTVTVRLEYAPSQSDQRDALHDLLNKATKTKTAAVDRLRKAAAAMTTASQTESRQNNSIANKKPVQKAVKSGFLNKPVKKKEPGFFVRLYRRSVGPDSMFRNVFPIAKNYIMFFGVLSIMHYKGQELSLPQPI